MSVQVLLSFLVEGVSLVRGDNVTFVRWWRWGRWGRGKVRVYSVSGVHLVPCVSCEGCAWEMASSCAGV